MPTIAITQEIGLAITKLNKGWALCYGYFYRGSGQIGEHFVWNLSPVQAPTTTGRDMQIKVKEETFTVLKKFKLIQKYSGNYSWWNGWARSRVWILSDAGKAFQLPPEEYWLEDEE